jgi:hypothetical protein
MTNVAKAVAHAHDVDAMAVNLSDQMASFAAYAGA